MSVLRWLFLLLTFSHAWAQWAQIGGDIDGNAAGDRSGTSVSSNGDGSIVAISAVYAKTNAGVQTGSVRIYQRSNNGWTQLGEEIIGDAAWDEVGTSVSLSADGFTVAIGMKKADNNIVDTGRVRVYHYTNGAWTKLGQDINGPDHHYTDKYSMFGFSVSISADGSIVAIGAYQAKYNQNNNDQRGSVQVYKYTNSAWTQIGGTLIGQQHNGRFGHSVSLSSDGTVLAVGEHGNTVGHVQVYQYSNSEWTQLGENIDGETSSDNHGHSVSLNTDGTIVACAGILHSNAIGFVRVFEYINGAWTQLGEKMEGEAYADSTTQNVKESVSINADGNIVAFGARGNDATGTDAGHVRVYKYSNSAWAQLGSDIDGEAAGDFSGESVSLSDDGYTVFIGAWGNDAAGDTAGHVRAYGFPKPPCAENQHVSSGSCIACAAGKTRAAGDEPTGGDTACDTTLCEENHHVVNNVCTACVAGKTRAAGDPATVDTVCDATLCQEDHHVVNKACQPCALGTRPAGDDASGDDTQCEVGPCGGLTCVRGTCVNNVCDCPVGFSGMTCSKDMTASGQLQFLESKRKSLPSKDDIKRVQRDVKSFIKDTLKKALLTKSVKEAVRETKMVIEERDLTDRAKLAVLQVKKQPVIALSTENKDSQDDCLQSDCAHVDIKDSPDQIVFLNTQEEAGSWSVLSSGRSLLTKQTRVSENVYDMQCWNNSWSEKVRFDISEGSDFYECNDHVILIGSQAAVCTDETCQNGGTCAQDGLSFVCDCPTGYGGEFCENEVTVGNCYDLDCSDFGGHKTEQCTECTEANCCNYATRDLFNAHCDTLTSTVDYVDAKCCHRTYCI